MRVKWPLLIVWLGERCPSHQCFDINSCISIYAWAEGKAEAKATSLRQRTGLTIMNLAGVRIVDTGRDAIRPMHRRPMDSHL